MDETAPRYQQIGPCPACTLGAPEVQGKQAPDGRVGYRVWCPVCGFGHGLDLAESVPIAISLFKVARAKPPVTEPVAP